MSGNGRSLALEWVTPPRMVSSFSYQVAPMLMKVLKKGPPLHTVTSSSVKLSSAACRASERLNSNASERISRNEDISCSFVSSWALTPGTSSIQPIHHSPSFFVIAVNVEAMSANLPETALKTSGHIFVAHRSRSPMDTRGARISPHRMTPESAGSGGQERSLRQKE